MAGHGTTATAGVDVIDVRSPFSGEIVGSVEAPDAAAVDRALDGAAAAAPATAALSASERSELLYAASQRIADRAQELARTIALEAGKPGWQPIRVKLVAERGTGRLLGGQLTGREGVATRVDVLAAALHAGATVGDVAEFNLSYAPPSRPCGTRCSSPPARPSRPCEQRPDATPGNPSDQRPGPALFAWAWRARGTG